MNLRRRSGLRTALNFQGKAVRHKKRDKSWSCNNGLPFRCWASCCLDLNQEGLVMGAVGSLVNTFRFHSDNIGPPRCFLHSLSKSKQDSLLHTHSCRSCRECQQATALLVSLSTLPTPTRTQLQKAFGAQGFISAGIHIFSLSANAKFPFSCREPGVEFALAVQVF